MTLDPDPLTIEGDDAPHPRCPSPLVPMLVGLVMGLILATLVVR